MRATTYEEIKREHSNVHIVGVEGYNMKASLDDFSALTEFVIKQGRPQNSFMNEDNSYQTLLISDGNETLFNTLLRYFAHHFIIS